MKPSFTPFWKQITLCFAAGFIPTAVCLLLLWTGSYDNLIWLTTLAIVGFSSVAFPAALYASSKHQWQIASNILASFRERDFSLRAHDTLRKDPISETMREINRLEETLKLQRLSSIERQNLLIKILREVDIAIFCIDSENKVTLANHYAAELFSSTPEKIIGRTSNDLNLDQIIDAASHTAMEVSFPNRQSRWLIKQGHYHEHGKPNLLLLLADLGQALREEELLAWKRLIRVIAHELNNSMTPVKSMTQTLARIVSKKPLQEGWREDVSEGLSIIGNRVENLNRFLSEYSKFARMPAPKTTSVDLPILLKRIVKLDPRATVELSEGPAIEIEVDEAQLEQALINVIKNAIDAVEPTSGNVSVCWYKNGDNAIIEIRDEGRGLAGVDNLFVPYFSTKPEGSGVGLFLSRQMIESHSGTLILENRSDQSGCIATIILPLK